MQDFPAVHLPESISDLPQVRAEWPGTCFVCSQGHPHGLHLRFHHTDDGVACICSIPAGYCGFDGMVHGGIISALMDEAAAYSLFARHGKLGVTREMQTRFLKPVPTETEIRVVGQIASFAATQAEVSMAVFDAAGERLAEGRTFWAFPRLSRIASLAGVEEAVLQRFLDDCQVVG